jgi:hypothetical protein
VRHPADDSRFSSFWHRSPNPAVGPFGCVPRPEPFACSTVDVPTWRRAASCEAHCAALTNARVTTALLGRTRCALRRRTIRFTGPARRRSNRSIKLRCAGSGATASWAALCRCRRTRGRRALAPSREHRFPNCLCRATEPSRRSPRRLLPHGHAAIRAALARASTNAATAARSYWPGATRPRAPSPTHTALVRHRYHSPAPEDPTLRGANHTRIARHDQYAAVR